jgi:membrane protease YdiL (CAAX protease family)
VPSPIVAVVTAGGLFLMLARPWLVANGLRSSGLMVVYAVLVTGSLLAAVGGRVEVDPASVRVEERELHPLVVDAAGIGALMVARRMAGPVPPLPAGAVALCLGAVAAVAEEAFFRKLVYGALAPSGAAVAVVVSALAFALVHVPLYGGAVFWVDFGAGLVLGWQRWASGSWAAPAATHVAANVLAVLR